MWYISSDGVEVMRVPEEILELLKSNFRFAVPQFSDLKYDCGKKGYTIPSSLHSVKYSEYEIGFVAESYLWIGGPLLILI